MADRRPSSSAKDEAVVLETIASYCVPYSPVTILQDMASAMEKGYDLALDVLDGKTNDCYKVYVKNSPDLAVFCKLCNHYAKWDPLQTKLDGRTDQEFQTMKILSTYTEEDSSTAVAGDILPTPYFCHTLEDGRKLLVTEYVDSNVTWGTHFVSTKNTNSSIVPTLIKALAKLHCYSSKDLHHMEEAGEDFPFTASPFYPVFLSIMNDAKARLAATVTGLDDSRTGCLAQEYGQAVCNELLDTVVLNFGFCQDCLVHNDLHAFNILVNPQPAKGDETIDDGELGALSRFAVPWVKADKDLSVKICDWEVAGLGPIGRDVGLLIGWPIACLLWHTKLGSELKAVEILDLINDIWDEYHDALKMYGEKDEVFLAKTFRNVIGWAGWFLFVNVYTYGAFTEHWIPNKQSQSNSKDMDHVRDSIGYVGLKLLHMGFYGDEESQVSLFELRDGFFHALQSEQDAMLGISSYIPRDHRNSVLLYTRRSSCHSDLGSQELSFGDSFKPRRDSHVM